MPSYSYICQNQECQHAFSQTMPAQQVDDLQFCPVCGSFATRDYRDLKTVSTTQSTSTPPHNSLPKGRGDKQPHVHSATCGCAISQDWESVANSLTPDDMKR